MVERSIGPVIISFYTDDPYYKGHAAALADRCDRFGLAHDIRRIEMAPDETWADICRRKIPFYKEMLTLHGRDVMWLDADTNLVGDVRALSTGAFDMALFLRNFLYLPKDDVSQLARSFHPGYILFRHTPKTLRFLEDCQRIDAATSGRVTDDYILEEAFRTSETSLRLLLLSPDDIQKERGPDRPEALFVHGHSGNVEKFRDTVEQHQPRFLRTEAALAAHWKAVEFLLSNGRSDAAVDLLAYMFRIAPDNLPVYTKLLQLLDTKETVDRQTYFLQKGLTSETLRPMALRMRFERKARDGRWDEVEQVIDDLEQIGATTDLAYVRSRMYRHDLDRRAAGQNIPDDDRLPLFWWEQPFPGNLGDIINPYVVEGLTGLPPRYARAGQGVCAIGSIIRFAGDGLPVWGSGTPRESAELNPKADYRAVRGPLTRAAVQKAGADCPEVYGDPAWLLPLIHARTPETSHETGLILHYTHEEACPPLEDVHRIPILCIGYPEIEAFLDQLTGCRRIISTSLHGLIIAHAYGVPAAYATLSDSRRQVHGDGMKFQDYFQSVGLQTPIDPIDLSEFARLAPDSLPDTAFTLPRQPIALERLLSVAPFDVPEETLRKARAFDAGQPFVAGPATPVRRPGPPTGGSGAPEPAAAGVSGLVRKGRRSLSRFLGP